MLQYDRLNPKYKDVEVIFRKIDNLISRNCQDVKEGRIELFFIIFKSCY